MMTDNHENDRSQKTSLDSDFTQEDEQNLATMQRFLVQVTSQEKRLEVLMKQLRQVISITAAILLLHALYRLWKLSSKMSYNAEGLNQILSVSVSLFLFAKATSQSGLPILNGGLWLSAKLQFLLWVNTQFLSKKFIRKSTFGPVAFHVLQQFRASKTFPLGVALLIASHLSESFLVGSIKAAREQSEKTINSYNELIAKKERNEKENKNSQISNSEATGTENQGNRDKLKSEYLQKIKRNKAKSK